MTTFTTHVRNRIEEFCDIDRRRYGCKLGACDRANYYPGTQRVGHVTSPSYHHDIRCTRVRDALPLIEDVHFDPLFDGWGEPLLTRSRQNE